MNEQEKAKRFDDVCELLKRRDEKIKELQAIDASMALVLSASVKEIPFISEVVEDHSL